jgi:hypothetical protein
MRSGGFAASSVVAIVAGACAFALPAAAGGGEAGTVRVRMTVDDKPVADHDVTLLLRSDVDESNAGETATTNAKGRIEFTSVEPGRYLLSTAVSFEIPDRGVKCKNPGYSGFSIEATDDSGRSIAISSLQTKKGFTVEAGTRVTKSIKVDCKPNVDLLPSSGGGEEPAAPRPPEEESYLAQLGASRSDFASDDEAVEQGRAVCDDLRAGSFNLDLGDDQQFAAAAAATETLCPEYRDLVQEFPS